LGRIKTLKQNHNVANTCEKKPRITGASVLSFDWVTSQER